MSTQKKNRRYSMQFMTMGLFCFLSLVNLYFLLSIKFEFDRPKRLQQQIESSQSTSATTIINGRCQCEIVSLDCLESIACIPRGVDLQESIAEGTYIRNLIRKMATVEGEGQPWPSDPLGKATQYTTIEAYLNWSNKGVLNPMESFSTFVNSSVYPDCVEKNLESKDCFFHAIDETDYIDPIEEYANKQNAVTEENKKSLKMELEFFRKKNKYEGNTLSAKSHLMVFAHLCRIYFNIRDPIIESYKKHLKIIHAEDSPEEMSSGSKSQGDILRVSLHVRRADSCEHEKEGFGQRYLDKPSEFNSTAQVSGKRFCYNTAVYMNAVQKAKELAGSPSLEVYLSTDYAGELMNEIREQFPDLYRSTTWKYMNFPRDTFDYDAFIEAGDHHDHKKPFLGETAVDDLWHLSHGQVFIGHLGSRFGKVGWLLATAKYNTLIPFYTVDGRSYCCEIDENCAEAALQIGSMNHCLTFVHDIVGYQNDLFDDQELYWEIGSTIRKQYVEKLKLERQKLDNFLGSSTF